MDDHHVDLTRARWSASIAVCATIVAVVLGTAPSVHAASGSRAASTRGSITLADGSTRTYRMHVPRSLPRSRPVPLLVALHGGFGSGAQFEANSGFDALADTHHFIVVYPDGTPIRAQGALADARVWNGGRCCGPAARDAVDDVGFISQLIDRVSQQHDVDRRRVYAAGHSNGAIMAYRLACELSDKVVAIGIQAGSLEVDRCEPTHPVSVLHIHGTADRNIPIDGGRGRGVAGIAFQPPHDAVTTLARVDGCPAASSTTAAADNPAVSIETWQPCDGSTAVRFVTVAGASHAWMDVQYDSSAAIWSFLAAHPRT
jgi:polyhydroxybutyrate depolymerase